MKNKITIKELITNPVTAKEIFDTFFGDSGVLINLVIDKYSIKTGDLDPSSTMKLNELQIEMAEILAEFVNINRCQT